MNNFLILSIIRKHVIGGDIVVRQLKMLAKTLIRILITMLFVIMIALIPSIYEYERDEIGRLSSMNINISSYFSNVGNYINQLFHGDLGSYEVSSNSRYVLGGITKMRSVSSVIFTFYKTTVIIFLSGLFLGTFFGLFSGYLTLLLRQKWRTIIQTLSFLVVAIPDFFIILILQISIIWIYKRTGIRFFAIANGGNSTALFLPIFTLSLFPFIYVFRTTINSFEEVLSNQYIQTAYSKGLRKFEVIWNHVFKNGLIDVLHNLPSILVLTISNLVILEYLYNLNGITMFIFNHHRSLNVLGASIILIWILVEVILLINDALLKWLAKGDVNA